MESLSGIVLILLIGVAVAVAVVVSKGRRGAPPARQLPRVAQTPAGPVQAPVEPARSPERMDGIFISYRRQDEPNFAGRLYDKLVERFGDKRVFIDVDSIDLGLDFADVIDRSLARCRIMLVVIGRHWLEVADSDGQPRLRNEDDYVRLEIEKALAKSDVRVIPVVVEGATVPKSSELPPSMASLARRNGIEMSHAKFGADVERLIRAIERVLDPAG